MENYVDDSTQSCAGKSSEFVVNNLEQLSTILLANKLTMT